MSYTSQPVDRARRTKKTIAIAPNGGAGDYAIQTFVFTGMVRAKFWAEVVGVDEVTVMSGAGLSLFDDDDWTKLKDITAHTLDLSAVALNAKLIRNSGDGTDNLDLKSGLNFLSDNGNAPLIAEVIMHDKEGAESTVQFLVTMNADTDAEIRWYCEWVPLTDGASVTEGDGSVHKLIVA